MNTEEEILKILSNELKNSIDTEIINNINIIKNMVSSKSWRRKKSIDNLYKKITISE